MWPWQTNNSYWKWPSNILFNVAGFVRLGTQDIKLLRCVPENARSGFQYIFIGNLRKAILSTQKERQFISFPQWSCLQNFENARNAPLLTVKVLLHQVQESRQFSSVVAPLTTLLALSIASQCLIRRWTVRKLF